MNLVEDIKAKDWTLADECAGLADEPGVDIESCPITADEAAEYQVVLFAWWWDANASYGSRKSVVSNTRQYAIFEKSYFNTLSPTERQNYRKLYGKFCLVVSDGFFDWVNTEKYKMKETPLAQMWIDQMGDRYCIDIDGQGHALTRVGEDKAMGTTADYWLPDRNDVMLKSMVNDFAETIGQAMDMIPVKVKEKRGPGRPPKEAESNEGTPEFVAEERDKVMRYYRETLSKRYDAFAGYSRDLIIRRIKENKEKDAVEMNNLERTGSLVPLANGVYDLRKDVFRSATPDDHISVYAPTWYNPNAKDKNVEKFIDQFTCGREDLRDFLGQVLGVGLDLNMLTRTLCELWGQTTSNGKSTIVKALVKTLGKGEANGLAQVLSNKAIAMSADAADDSCPTPSLGMIRFARLLFASEPDRGMKVNWAVVKQLTSGDSIPVRQLYEKPRIQPARATLLIDTNHALRVTDPTVFTRGTIQVLPCDFKVTDDNKDDEIDAKLSTETAKSAWVNFMLWGYKSYVANGNRFCNPPCVQAALAKNKEQSDRIGCFIKENYIVGQSLTKKVALHPMWEEYKDWCQDNGYTHPEVYSTFAGYFDSNSRVYTTGELHKQKALCGVVKISPSEETHQIITGDPIDWYISEYMVSEPQSDGQQMDMDGQTEAVKTVKLETVHTDYKRKVTDAGGQALEFWQFYGELMGRKWSITMGTPGDTSSIMVTGWHIASKAELRAKKEAKVEARAAAIRRDVKNVLANMDIEAAAALQVLMRVGLNSLMDGVSDEARRIITDAVTTGMDREIIINAIAHE